MMTQVNQQLIFLGKIPWQKILHKIYFSDFSISVSAQAGQKSSIYVSDSESFEYQADNKNRNIFTAGLGFDFKHDQGLTISTDYERQQIQGHGFINKFIISTGFLYRKETELALGLSEDMTSNFKISKALDGFDLVFDLENDFSNQENHNANLSLLSKF